jgi:hypothetical protein
MPGTLTYSPADILRQLMVDLSLGTTPSDDDSWPIYCSVQPDTPDNLITTYDTTGVHQGRVMTDGEVQERHGVQILIRSSRFTTGWTKSRAISVALDAAYDASVVMGVESYTVHAISRSSGPIALGKEVPVDGGNTPSSKREVFSLNCTVSVRED